MAHDMRGLDALVLGMVKTAMKRFDDVNESGVFFCIFLAPSSAFEARLIGKSN